MIRKTLMMLAVFCSMAAWGALNSTDFESLLPMGEDQPWQMKYVYQSMEYGEPSDDSNGNPWYAANYNDSSWKTLTGPVARNNRDVFSQVNFEWDLEQSCFYLRRSFTLSEIPDGCIFIKAMVDDHMTAYVNGQELNRYEDIIEGPNDLRYDIHLVPQSVLRVGENTLAIYVNDDGGGEAYLDYGMFAGDGFPGILLGSSDEGIELVFKIISEEEKTCAVGNGGYYESVNIPSDYEGSLTIPSEVNGYAVIEVSDYAFNFKNITSVTFPEGLKRIGYKAFEQCPIKSLNFPSTLIEVSGPSFRDCSRIESITVAEGNKVYDSRDNCNGLIATESDALIIACANTKIPYGVKSIEEDAYFGRNLTEFPYLPSSVETLVHTSFFGNPFTKIVIPEGVKLLNGCVFQCCMNLQSVTIPSTMEAFSLAPFNECHSIREVITLAEPFDIPDSSFDEDVYEKATLYVPNGSKEKYMTANGWNKFKSIVGINTNRLMCEDLESSSGSTPTLKLILDNEDEVKLCQFDLRLPEGVTVATKSNGKLDASLTERAENHRISSQRLSNGDYRFIVSSLDYDSFTGNSGTLMEIKLDVSATMEEGEYTVKLLNAELSVPDGNDLKVVKPADTESKLIVKNYTPGDVNNDGSVSVTDVGCAINYILEQVPSVFVFEAADMNGDKTVSVTDVGMIINLILNEGISCSRGIVEENVNNDHHFSPNLSLQTTAEGYELLLEDKEAFIGFQFDVELVDGATINDVQLIGATESDHLLTCRRLDNGKWRVVCYSPTNSTFAADDASLLTISVVGNASERYFTGNAGTATLGSVAHFSDIRLTTVGLDELRPAALVSMPTGIANVEQGMKMGVQGNTLCITSDRDTTLRLLTIGGSVCRILHVHRGQNNFDDLRAGIYMIDNKKIIIR